jgi:hypothetical protein
MKALFATCMFVAVAGTTFTAQTTQPTDTPAARAGWIFQPSFTFGGNWDDNVLLVGPGTEQPSDYVTAVTPAGSLGYGGRRLQLTTGYRGSFLFYRELSGLNSLAQSARGRLQYRLTPTVTVFGGQSFAAAPATDLVEYVGIPFRRIGNRRYLTTTGIDVRLSPRTTLNAGYDFLLVDFDDDVTLAIPGGHEHVLAGTLRHQLSPRVVIGATYDARRVIILDEPAPIMLLHGAAIAEYRLSATVDIAGSLGFSRHGDIRWREGDTGLAWRGEVNARRQHFLITAYYERSLVPSFGFGGTFQNEELAGSVQGALARDRVYWQAGAAWRDNDPLFLIEPSRRSVWLTSRVGYRVSPWLSVEGFYTQAHQDASRVLEGTIESNRFGFQIVTSKPLRLAR